MQVNDEPLKHIRRRQLPWRDSGITECGRLASEFPERVIFTDAVDVLILQYGVQRSAFLLCITCFERWQTGAYYWRGNKGLFGTLEREGQNNRALADVNLDLAALAKLVEAHPSEFLQIRAAIAAGITPEEFAALEQVKARTGGDA